VSNDHKRNNTFGLFYHISLSLNHIQNFSETVDFLKIHNCQAIGSEKEIDLSLEDYDSQAFSLENKIDSQDSLSNEEPNKDHSNICYRSYEYTHSYTYKAIKKVDTNKQHKQASVA
ncbi:28171_t:CDS:2, partial [Racocetra persica]